jgi:hypothetical protein
MEIEKQTEEKFQQGIIEESDSPWSSNVVVIRKNGKARVALDLRQLNQFTVPDAYPMPRVQDLTDCLAGAMFFTAMDAAQAFHLIPMHDLRAKNLTSFATPGGGLYRYKRMPFGLRNAMAVWSRLIDRALRGAQWVTTLAYADDVLAYTKTDDFISHIDEVEKIINMLGSAGIKLKAIKLELAHKELPFLGFRVGRKGVSPDPSKTKAISDLQPPTVGNRVKALRGHLGMFGHYRKFIEEYTKIAAPLNALTKQGVSFKWGPEENTAFETLKAKICSDPIFLQYPDFDKPFEIQTDACKIGLAGTLMQNHNGVLKVCMYASRATTDNEKKYNAYELECLAAVWAIELFRHYVQMKPFILRTDCYSIEWLQTRTVGSRVLRWALRLQEFEYEVVYTDQAS